MSHQRQHRKRAAEVPAPLPPVLVLATYSGSSEFRLEASRTARAAAPNPPQESGSASGPSAQSRRFSGLIASLINHLVFCNPRHHGAQLAADFLNLMLIVQAPRRLEVRLTSLALEHPITREAAGLNIGENALHLERRLREVQKEPMFASDRPKV